MASISRNIRVILALAVPGFALPPAMAQAPAAGAQQQSFEQRHKDMVERSDLQFEFTPQKDLPPPDPDTLGWLDQLLDAMAPLFNLIFWGALAAGGVALLWFVGREAWAGRPGQGLTDGNAPDQATDFRPEASRARALLAEADRLAALGQFDEAVRVLLHRSIDDIEQRAPNSIRKAQTSREIGGMPILPDAVRAAFAPITRAVEESWFGGRAVDAARYQDCRKAYADFALADSWT